MTNTWTGDATQPTRSESWFSTTSPDVAIHIGETSFYSHRLRLLGHSNSFGLTGCLTCVGPITVGDITYETDVHWISASPAPATPSMCPWRAGLSRGIGGNS